ncbi:hypothetical protein GIB67_038897, partial [Kingdonia uniflora]
IRSRDECNIFSSAFHGIYRFMRYRNSEFSLTATGVLDITLVYGILLSSRLLGPTLLFSPTCSHGLLMNRLLT